MDLNPGVWISGVYINTEPMVKRDSGEVYGYEALIACGVDAYKVRFDSLPPAKWTLGTLVCVQVRPRVYNGNIYYNGISFDSAA